MRILAKTNDKLKDYVLRFKCDSFAIVVNNNTGDYVNWYKKELGSAFEFMCGCLAPHEKYEA